MVVLDNFSNCNIVFLGRDILSCSYHYSISIEGYTWSFMPITPAHERHKRKISVRLTTVKKYETLPEKQTKSKKG
jgi:hypothetical protein